MSSAEWFSSCEVCGKFVLPIDGWGWQIHSYHNMVATWENKTRFIKNSVHFSCLETWEHRNEFRNEVFALLRGFGQYFTAMVDGKETQIPRNGFGFGEILFTGNDCIIMSHLTGDEIVVLENNGKWHPIKRTMIQQIAAGQLPRPEAGVGPTVLPDQNWDDIATLTLEQLLSRLDVTKQYETALAQGDIYYEFYGYYPPKRILEFAEAANYIIPDEATEFIRTYIAPKPAYQ